MYIRRLPIYIVRIIMCIVRITIYCNSDYVHYNSDYVHYNSDYVHQHSDYVQYRRGDVVGIVPSGSSRRDRGRAKAGPNLGGRGKTRSARPRPEATPAARWGWWLRRRGGCGHRGGAPRRAPRHHGQRRPGRRKSAPALVATSHLSIA